MDFDFQFNISLFAWIVVTIVSAGLLFRSTLAITIVISVYLTIKIPSFGLIEWQAEQITMLNAEKPALEIDLENERERNSLTT